MALPCLLATLAFDYPRRATFFTGELEAFLVMTRDEGMDPTEPKGSYAGAMGYGQFMPSSFRQWAVDGNGDGRREAGEITLFKAVGNALEDLAAAELAVAAILAR